MLRLLLVLALLPPQDDDLRALVRLLGDDDAPAREGAERALEKRGKASLDALSKALQDPDLEVRSRAEDLLRRIDPWRSLPTRIAAQRESKLRLLATGEAPTRETVITDGISFTFQRPSVWIDRKEIRGLIFPIYVHAALDGEIDWVASLPGDPDRRIERCSNHTDDIYVPDERFPKGRIVIKGTRRWFCDIPVEFRDPSDGDFRRIGPYTLTIRWPRIEVRSEAPLRASTIALMLRSHEIQGRPRPGRGRELPVVQQPTDEPAIFFPEAKEEMGKETWCGCSKDSDRSFRPPRMLHATEVQVPFGATPIEDLGAIIVKLRVPIEEAFEVASQPLK